jgi:hypothetical protein
MNGDIKLATLSDTDDTDVTGSELVTNGTFDSGTSDWTVGGTGASGAVASGQYTLTRNGTSARLTQTISGMTDGAKYLVSFDLVGSTGSASVRVDFEGSSSDTTNTNGVVSFTATASGTIGTLQFNVMNTTSGTITFDNVSIRLAEEDRSVNGNGLQVFGTVQKNPVNTGADLVAYSGFNSTNGLRQPYNSDLEFGTGDFCVMCWFKQSATSSNEKLLTRDSGNQERFQFYTTNGYLAVFTQNGSSSWQYSNEVVPFGVWNLGCAIRRNGSLEIYLNGKRTIGANSTPTVARNISFGSTAKVWIGNSPVNYNPWAGSLALARISATAPSPEQIARIYNDEKHLFTEGAQATLYGSSDSVTALAFDDTTNLLHVGTSAGRSVFQGLRRVDNTTTAVTAAISASNGLVADE